MWWVSYRGEGRHAVGTIGVFEDDGRERPDPPLLHEGAPQGHRLQVARGFALVGDDLYVANAWRRDSHIARYTRDCNRFRYADNLITPRDVAALIHPFDVDLGDDGRLYVSCQDTNTVIAYLPRSRRPAAVAAHLKRSFPGAHFLPGTLVASRRGRLPAIDGTPPQDVPPPLGLEVVLDDDGAPRHSVRGIVVHRRHLYVADEAGDAVKVFAVATGRLVAHVAHPQLRRPVHLKLHGERLYIGAAGSGSLLACPLPHGAPDGELKPTVVIDGHLHAPAGFVVGPDGNFYVSERHHRRIRRFAPDGSKLGTFIDDLPDMPEFILHIEDRH